MGAWYSFSCCSYEWYNYINQQRERETKIQKDSLQMRIQNWYVRYKTIVEELFWWPTR